MVSLTSQQLFDSMIQKTKIDIYTVDNKKFIQCNIMGIACEGGENYFILTIINATKKMTVCVKTCG